jgi:hypothetical protein
MKPIPDFENDPQLTHRQKLRRRQYYANRDRAIKQAAAWCAENPEKTKRHAATSRDRNREKLREAGRQYQKRRRVQDPEAARAWYWKDRVRILAIAKTDTRSLRQETIEEYGGYCACCGESQIEFLCLDHINGDGAHERRGPSGSGRSLYRKLKKQGFPKGRYQVLCHNCNMAIGLYGVCPHQEIVACLTGVSLVRRPVLRTRLRQKEPA